MTELSTAGRAFSKAVTPPPSAKATSRVPEIDLLRFVAAAAVMIYHLTYRPIFGGVIDEQVFGGLQSISRFGYLGVELFFMISGFVILWSSSGRTAPEFVISRVARLYPSFWTCVLITTLAILLLDPVNAVPPGMLAANLTMIPSLLSVDYIDGVYWTLFVELKFYFLIFALLITGTMQWAERWLGIWLVLYVVCALGGAPHLLESLVMFGHGSFFISGCILFLIRSGGKGYRFAALGISCVLCMADAHAAQIDFMHVVDLTTTVTVMTAIAFFHLAMLAVALVPSLLPASRSWYILGSLTYPLYLLHSRISKMIASVLDGDIPPFGTLLIQISVSLALASVVAAVMERRACSRFQRLLMRLWEKMRLPRHQPA
jgi:peptidoglycan/LPS O-acetylase OafA/YrhL